MKYSLHVVLLTLLSILSSSNSVKLVQVCDEENAPDNYFIYCSGKLLDAVNHHELYNDSKTFVDMPMKEDPAIVQQKFNDEFGNQHVENINKTELQIFVDTHFSDAGAALINCVPPDWHESPKKLEKIEDPNLRAWAMHLNDIWKKLCKQIDPATAAQDKARHSLLYVPNMFIAPGGRFREFYYWDAYWIIKGLIASEMYTTTRYMIENLASMVETHGFVPNGGRIYYLRRSQPPLLSGMLYEYFEATRDMEFVKKMLPTMEKELQFWQKNRTVNVNLDGQDYEVYQYNTPSNVPRPEAYSQDIKKSAHLLHKNQFYQDIASTAESGWDFSTRWFSDKKTIYHVETTKIVPIDLNSYICWNMDIMDYLYEQSGNFNKSEQYREMRAKFRNTVHNVFYNKTSGAWFDYNLRTKSQNPEFYPSVAVPLFTGCYNSLDQSKSERIFDYMQKQGVFEFSSGIPASIIQDSEEQWDFPNGWSHLNHMIIEGLRKSQNPAMQDQAFELAKKWVLGNYNVWKETNHMWEKYNVIGDYPRPGSGGEYDVQDGFGWTNGVILDLLVTYSDRLFLPEVDQGTTRFERSTETEQSSSGVPESTVTQKSSSETQKVTGTIDSSTEVPEVTGTTRAKRETTTSKLSSNILSFVILVVSLYNIM